MDQPNSPSTDGAWSFDQSTRKYTIKLNDEALLYSAVAPGDYYNCMLIKGDPQTADLSRSWDESAELLEHDQILHGSRSNAPTSTIFFASILVRVVSIHQRRGGDRALSCFRRCAVPKNSS